MGTSARFDCLKAGRMRGGADRPAGRSGRDQTELSLASVLPISRARIYPFNVDMARRAWGEKNQATLVRLVRGFAASYEFINDPKNHEVTNIVMESLKVSEEPRRQISRLTRSPTKTSCRKGNSS